MIGVNMNEFCPGDSAARLGCAGYSKCAPRRRADVGWADFIDSFKDEPGGVNANYFSKFNLAYNSNG